MSSHDAPAYATRSRSRRATAPTGTSPPQQAARPPKWLLADSPASTRADEPAPMRSPLDMKEQPERLGSQSSPLTPLSSQEILVPASSLKLSSLDKEIDSLAFGVSDTGPETPFVQGPGQAPCSLPSSRPSLSGLFTPPGAQAVVGASRASGNPSSAGSFDDGRLQGPPVAQPRNNSFFLDKQIFQGETDDADRQSGESSPPATDAGDEEEYLPATPDHGNTHFAHLGQLRGLFDDESEDGDDPDNTSLVPISSAFKADNCTLRRGSVTSGTETSPGFANHPRLTFSSCSTPSPSKRAEPRKPATNKSGAMRLKELQQLKRFPRGLKLINRSPLKLWKWDRRNMEGSDVQIEVDRSEDVELLNQLRKRRKRSHTNDPQLHWPFTPSKDKENIQTPPLLPTCSGKRHRGSRNASVSRLHFSRKLAEAIPRTTESPGPLKVPNSCPSEPSSTATRDIASLCGTASLKRYQMPAPPSMPSGLSEPPSLDVEQEIEMWDEGEERCQRTEVTAPDDIQPDDIQPDDIQPDDIQPDMSSWVQPPKENEENQPAPASQARTTAPTSRQVLRDITSQFAHAPTPSLSGMDLTGHLMALAERLEPVRTLPRRRPERGGPRQLKPPHQTLRPNSVASPVPLVRAVPRSQPLPARDESSSPLEARPSCESGRAAAPEIYSNETCPRVIGTGGTNVRLSPRKRSCEGAYSRDEAEDSLGSCTQSTQDPSQRIQGGIGAWCDPKRPSRAHVTPPPELSEVDARHTELAKAFASFAVYLQRHEESAPRPPALRVTKSVGHTFQSRPVMGIGNATQIPIRGP